MTLSLILAVIIVKTSAAKVSDLAPEIQDKCAFTLNPVITHYDHKQILPDHDLWAYQWSHVRSGPCPHFQAGPACPSASLGLHLRGSNTCRWDIMQDACELDPPLKLNLNKFSRSNNISAPPVSHLVRSPESLTSTQSAWLESGPRTFPG